MEENRNSSDKNEDKTWTCRKFLNKIVNIVPTRTEIISNLKQALKQLHFTPGKEEIVN